jgi:hypothetical protein
MTKRMILRTDVSPEEMSPKELRNVGLKRCAGSCGEIKPRTDFGSNGLGQGPRSYCGPCDAAKQLARRAANPEKFRRYDRERRSNPEVKEHRRSVAQARRNADIETARANETRRDLALKFNITIDQYEKMLRDQGGVCAICRQPCKMNRRLSVDHDHSCCPGKRSCGRCVRGLLCANCNTGLGHLGDDLDRLVAAAEYLRSSTA